MMKNNKNMGKLIPLIFLLVIIHLTIIIIVIILVNNKWKRTKKMAGVFLHKLGHVIPNFSRREHKYAALKWNNRHPDNNEFDVSIAVFLAKCNMCAYNIINKYKSRLHPSISVIRTLGTHGYMFKLNKRNTYILAYRGTVTGTDVSTDLDFSQIMISSSQSKVHEGFYNLWFKEFDLYDYKFNDGDIIYVTGHSLGASLATLTALKLSKIFKTCKVICYIFAPPRIGNTTFVNELSEQVEHHWAIINKVDIIPTLPPGAAMHVDGIWLYDDYKQNIYINVQNGTLVENHHLDTYLQGLRVLQDRI